MERYKEIKFQSADDLWEALSPTVNLGITPPCNLIYRGQGDSKWSLIPSALREQHLSKILYHSDIENDFSKAVILDEILSIKQFVEYCDRIGVRVPNDSQDFRQTYIGVERPANVPYLLNPAKWPNEKLLDIMALSQHHGMPTRLLDWTSLAYTACYFASSSAIANYRNWKSDSELAIWVLETNKMNEEDLAYVFRSPGSTSPNLAAQYGKFTVHPHNSGLSSYKDIKGLEDIISPRENPILLKLTIPANESARLLGICCIAGFSAADIYPSTDGASMAVRDDRNIMAARYFHIENGNGGLNFTQRKTT